jgi:hypothetical protein
MSKRNGKRHTEGSLPSIIRPGASRVGGVHVFGGYKKRALHPNRQTTPFMCTFPQDACAFTSTRVNARASRKKYTRKRGLACLAVENVLRARFWRDLINLTHKRVNHLLLYIGHEKGSKHHRRTRTRGLSEALVHLCVESRRNAGVPLGSAQGRHRLVLGGLVR